MRYLLDENLPERLARLLRERGLDAWHVRELGRGGLSDQEQLDYAAEQRRVLISRDYKDMPRLAVEFLTAERAHSGVALLPPSIANSDVGGSADAITAFNREFDAVQPYHVSWLQSARRSRD